MRRLAICVAVLALATGTGIQAANAIPVTTSGGAYCAVELPQQSWVCSDSPSGLASAGTTEARADATEYLIARLYDDSGYGTSDGYLNVYAAGDCTATSSDIDFSISNLDTWSNRVSSFQSFGDCVTRLWSGTSFSGTAYPSNTTFLTESSYVGAAFDNKARSAQFT